MTPSDPLQQPGSASSAARTNQGRTSYLYFVASAQNGATNSIDSSTPSDYRRTERRRERGKTVNMKKTSKKNKLAARSSKLVGDERGTELMPCPLCTGNARDRGHGISCEDCGLWLGDGSQAYRLGGYKAVWNRRAQNAEVARTEGEKRS